MGIGWNASIVGPRVTSAHPGCEAGGVDGWCFASWRPLGMLCVPKLDLQLYGKLQFALQVRDCGCAARCALVYAGYAEGGV